MLLAIRSISMRTDAKFCCSLAQLAMAIWVMFEEEFNAFSPLRKFSIKPMIQALLTSPGAAVGGLANRIEPADAPACGMIVIGTP